MLSHIQYCAKILTTPDSYFARKKTLNRCSVLLKHVLMKIQYIKQKQGLCNSNELTKSIFRLITFIHQQTQNTLGKAFLSLLLSSLCDI